MNTSASGHLSAQLFEAGGRLVRKWTPQPYAAGRVRLDFPLGNARLMPGHYILRLTDATGQTESRVVVRQ